MNAKKTKHQRKYQHYAVETIVESSSSEGEDDDRRTVDIYEIHSDNEFIDNSVCADRNSDAVEEDYEDAELTKNKDFNFSFDCLHVYTKEIIFSAALMLHCIQAGITNTGMEGVIKIFQVKCIYCNCVNSTRLVHNND